MSVFDTIKKRAKKQTSCVIPLQTAIVIETQEEFNILAKASKGQYQEDAIFIDGAYYAYSDDIGALNVEPIESLANDIENVLEALEHKNMKLMKFSSWQKRYA